VAVATRTTTVDALGPLQPGEYSVTARTVVATRRKADVFYCFLVDSQGMPIDEYVASLGPASTRTLLFAGSTVSALADTIALQCNTSDRTERADHSSIEAYRVVWL
jgi:hypothetical protein